MPTEAYEFARFVDNEIEKLTREEFFMRTGRSKKLREEIFPLSRLALHFAQPGLKVFVESANGSTPPDGHIAISGFRTEAQDVEITYVRSYEDSLRDELLHTVGASPGAGPIERNKLTHQIFAQQSGSDRGEQIAALAAAVSKRYEAKASKNYPASTILLIAFQDITFYGFSAWRELVERIGDAPARPFKRVYLLNCLTNELQAIA